MAIFEEESQSFQDESYRAHLDRNWSNGNKKLEAQDKRMADMGNTDYEGSNEVTQARIGVDGAKHDTLNGRLDDNELEVQGARGKFDNLSLREEAQDKQIEKKADETEVATKANITYVDSLISSITNGKPKGLFYSLSALNAQYPNGTTGVYLVFDSSFKDGAHSYVWDPNKSAWSDLGAYQSDYIPHKARSAMLVTKGIVNVNTSKKRLEFDGHYLAITDGYQQYQMDGYANSNFSVALDGFLVFDTNKNALKMIASQSEALETDLLLGYLYFDKGNFYINTLFTVDGTSNLPKRSIVNNQVTNINKPCIITTYGEIVIDTVNRKIIFPNANTIALTYGLTKVNLASTYKGKEFDASFNGSSAGWLYADPFQKIIKTDKDELDENCYLLGAIWWDKLKFDLNFEFKINGADYHTRLKGPKTIAALGDSLTYGIKRGNNRTTPYTDFLPKYTGSTVTNYGVAGTRVQIDDTRTDSFVERIPSVAQSDILIIFGGMNDYRGSYPLGDVAEVDTELADLDTHSFTGAMEYCINYWLNKYPQSQIFLVTIPLQKKDEKHSFVANKLGIYQKDYNDKIVELGQRYSLPVVDMWQLGISPFNAAQANYWMGDKMHYKSGAYDKIAQFIAGKIKEHLN